MKDTENPPGSAADEAPRFALPIYQGPLDLLLHLIKRAELDPREVATRAITEQYLAHLALMDQLNLDVAGEYLVMAATLLLIKSFALLPHPGLAETEEAEELRRDLVERLLEYQRYREAAAKLNGRAVLGRDVFAAPPQPLPASDEPAPLFAVSVFDLVQAMGAVLKRFGGRTPLALELRDIPIARCVAPILAALEAREQLPFAALFADLADRALVIATFIALLELIRRRAVRAWQEAPGGEILLSRGDRYAEPPVAADEALAESAGERPPEPTDRAAAASSDQGSES